MNLLIAARNGLAIGLAFAALTLVAIRLSIGVMVQEDYRRSANLVNEAHPRKYIRNPESIRIVNRNFNRTAKEVIATVEISLIDMNSRWTDLHIEVEYFDSQGSFIYECDQRFAMKLKMDESKILQINCHDEKLELLAKFGSFTARVFGAYEEK